MVLGKLYMAVVMMLVRKGSMKTLAGLFVSLQGTDGIMTYLAVNSGRYVEANPLTEPIAGSPLFPLEKVATGVVIVLLLLRLSHYPLARRAAQLALVLGVIILSFVLVANIAVLVA